MSSSVLISVDEYFHRSEKPASEYLAGVLRLRPMPTKIHALIQYLLVGLLRGQNVEALAEVTVRISEQKFLVPDVIASDEIQDPYPTAPVTLCVEILSPEDRIGAALAKCEDYHAWGVPFCWVIDPLKLKAWEYQAGSDPLSLRSDGVLRAGKLTVRLAELFSGLPAR